MAASSEESRREHPCTYMVQDHGTSDELTRLSIQDRLLTAGTGGLLPELPDLGRFQHVLDMGCGTGGWLIDVAKTYPTIPLLIGVDLNRRFLNYAREEAIAQQVDERVEFRSMDALRMLEFPNAFFDLINQRLASSFLRTWDWRKLLQEYARIIRPDGVLRITESQMITESNSAPYMRFNKLIFEALKLAGHYFYPEPDGVISELANLFRQHGFRDIQTYPHQIYYRAGSPQNEYFFDNAKFAVRTLKPFLEKWVRVPEDYEALCQEMLNDMQKPDFEAIWRLLTVTGKSPV